MTPLGKKQGKQCSLSQEIQKNDSTKKETQEKQRIQKHLIRTFVFLGVVVLFAQLRCYNWAIQIDPAMNQGR